MASPRRIDVHFHLIPPFYSEAVYEAGRGPAIGKYPDWTPELALELMDATASRSRSRRWRSPASASAARRARRRWRGAATRMRPSSLRAGPRRFGAFATVPMWSTQGALDEIAYCLDALKFDGVSLFASYGRIFSAIHASIRCWRC